MKARTLVVALAAVLASAGPLYAQNKQVRAGIHPTIGLGEHWMLAGWVVGNAKENERDNGNLIAGIGYRRSSWWLETMLQRQWSGAGNQWVVDVRSQWQVGKATRLFVQVSPFLTKRGTVYSFVSLERPIAGKLHGGLETEDAFRPGRDSLGLGPRISYPVFVRVRVRVMVAGSYQFRRASERNVTRLWVTVSPRF